MPARPIIPARQIAAICAALRPGQRAEIVMPGGAPIRIYGAQSDGASIDGAGNPDGAADTGRAAPDTPPDMAAVHDLGARIKASLAGGGA